MKRLILKLVVLAMFCVALYILSIGPAWALTNHGYLSEAKFHSIYSPLAGLENHCPGDLLWRYENWWSPKLGLHLK